MKTEILNACLSEKTYMGIIKQSKEAGTKKSVYARELLEQSLDKHNEDIPFSIKGFARTKRKKNGYMTIRVSEGTCLKVKEIAIKYGYTVPTLCGYFIEKAYKELDLE